MPFGLGLAALGRPGYLNVGHGDDVGSGRSPEAMERRAHEMLDAAYARGIRYFDAARSYGRAEKFLCNWLHARRPSDIVVGSKWGYVYTANWQVDADPPEAKHHDIETLERQLGETKRFLGAYLALYQIHSATPESAVLENDAVLDRLRELRASGVEIGVTVSGTSQPETIERTVELGMFDAVQATWNLHERAAEVALAAAHDAGMRVLVKEALANGRLSPRGGDERLEAVAGRLGVGSDAVALAAVLAQPWADTVLIGAATVEALESNLRAVEVDWTADIDEELAALVEPTGVYWRKRSELPWT